jgi:hypothetical protein
MNLLQTRSLLRRNHRQKRHTEASVLQKIDTLIQMLDRPELQTYELRTALGAARSLAALKRDADASEGG